jgi:hypothetical protein
MRAAVVADEHLLVVGDDEVHCDQRRSPAPTELA